MMGSDYLKDQHHAREQLDALLIQRALMPATLPVTSRFTRESAFGGLRSDLVTPFIETSLALAIRR